MHASRRWALVVLGTVVLLGAPIVVRALPAGETDVTAAELLAKVQASDAVAFSGYAESSGRLQLPATDDFSELATLLGERSRLRVWWRDADDWRVDTITTAGETDLFHAGWMTTEWDYESERATSAGNAGIRLPRSSDMLPPELGRLALRGASADEVSRIAAARVAGIDAPGLRLVPAAPQSTIDHVDVWAEPRTGLPLRVAVYADGDDSASVTSTFLDVTFASPSAAVTRFVPPPGSTFELDVAIDVAAAAQRFAPVITPLRLAGLASKPNPLSRRGAVGVYGDGVTTFFTVPLRDDAADPLRDQLARTPGVVVDADGTQSLSVGPVELLLTPEVFAEHSWLVVGTVTHDTLVRAAAQLRSRAFFLVAP